MHSPITFTLRGKTFEKSKEDFIKAAKDLQPEAFKNIPP